MSASFVLAMFVLPVVIIAIASILAVTTRGRLR